MLFIKQETNNRVVDIILTEKERYSLASQKAKDFVNQRMLEVTNFHNSNVDFFTGENVDENDSWYFTVGYNGVNYDCMYDNENLPEDELAREARILLMWRVDLPGGYIEVVGEYHNEDGSAFTAENTLYDDTSDYEPWDGYTVEKAELNDTNRDIVRNFFLA